MQPADRMRIASLAKAVTAVAILRLVEQGRLALSDRAFEIHAHLETPAGRRKDPRLATITISHLLHHEGGWSRTETGDPMFWSRRICQELGIPGPATAHDTLHYMLGQPLDFNPGTDFDYSNFGYSVLGRVIEQVTGMTFANYLRDEVLAPMGIRDMELGRTRPEDRPADEVTYHMYDGAVNVVSVFPSEQERVSRPQGGWHQEALDSHGGWIAHAVDLVRFVTAVDGRAQRSDFLSSQSIALMTQRPELPRWRGRDSYYAMGWSVRPTQGDANWWHMGSLPGTSTLFLRSWHGYNWVVLTNGRPADSSGFMAALDQAMWRAFETVRVWPEYDLFD
jgi:N-acyl-D-amino-acid deacylase